MTNISYYSYNNINLVNFLNIVCEIFLYNKHNLYWNKYNWKLYLLNLSKNHDIIQYFEYITRILLLLQCYLSQWEINRIFFIYIQLRHIFSTCCVTSKITQKGLSLYNIIIEKKRFLRAFSNQLCLILVPTSIIIKRAKSLR